MTGEDTRWCVTGAERRNRSAVLAEYSMTPCACGHEALRNGEEITAPEFHSFHLCITDEGSVSIDDTEPVGAP